MLKDEDYLDKPNKYFEYLNKDYHLFGADCLERRQIFEKSNTTLLLLLSEPHLENRLSNFIAERFNVNTSKYDTAIDSVYNTTKIGGSTIHHNLDGAHTFEGALDLLRENFPNESDFQLVLESLKHLSNDLTTPSGINPFLSPDDFIASKKYLIDNLDMSASSVNDLLNINAIELGSVITASLALVYNLENHEIDKLGEYLSRISMLSIISGNPALLLLSFILLGQSFIQLINQGKFLIFFDGVVAGALSTASFFYATVTLSGPLFPILVIGIASSFGMNWLYYKSKEFLREDLDDKFKSMFPAYKSYLNLI